MIHLLCEHSALMIWLVIQYMHQASSKETCALTEGVCSEAHHTDPSPPTGKADSRWGDEESFSGLAHEMTKLLFFFYFFCQWAPVYSYVTDAVQDNYLYHTLWNVCFFFSYSMIWRHSNRPRNKCLLWRCGNGFRYSFFPTLYMNMLRHSISEHFQYLEILLPLLYYSLIHLYMLWGRLRTSHI